MTKRVQFDLSDNSFQQLQKLKEDTGASSYAEVTSKSYKIHEFMNKAIKENKEIIIRDENGVETILQIL